MQLILLGILLLLFFNPKVLKTRDHGLLFCRGDGYDFACNLVAGKLDELALTHCGFVSSSLGIHLHAPFPFLFRNLLFSSLEEISISRFWKFADFNLCNFLYHYRPSFSNRLLHSTIRQ